MSEEQRKSMTAVNNINPSVFSNFIVQKQPIATQPQATVSPQENTSAVAQVALPTAAETIAQVESRQPQVEAQKESSLPSGAKVAIGVALAALAGVGIYVWSRRGAHPPVIKPVAQPPVVPVPPASTPTETIAVEGVAETVAQKTVEFKNKIAKGIREILESFKPEEDTKVLKSGKLFLLDRNVGLFRIRDKYGEAIVEGYLDSKGNLAEYFIARGNILQTVMKRAWRIAEDGSEYTGRYTGKKLLSEVKL